MQILEKVIKHRWGAIDDTQRAGIRNFVSNLIIKLSSDEQLFRQEKVYLNKLNIALVQVGNASTVLDRLPFTIWAAKHSVHAI